MAGFDGFRTMYESSQAGIILAINFEAEQRLHNAKEQYRSPPGSGLCRLIPLHIDDITNRREVDCVPGSTLLPTGRVKDSLNVVEHSYSHQIPTCFVPRRWSQSAALN
jgi:hypothetical protein